MKPRIAFARRAQAGFSLIEMMIALVVMSVVMGATVSLFRSQSVNFRVGGQRLELMQNLRYATGTVDRVLRTTGSGTTPQQPMVVYADSNVVAVNTNFTARVTDGSAVYINPSAPINTVNALPLASAYVLPNSGFTYPAQDYNQVNGQPSLAETVVLYFRPDSTTPDPADYLLLQRVNDAAPELVARNIYHATGRPFFEYYVHLRTVAVPPATKDSLVLSTLVAGLLPISHSAPVHGSVLDSNGTVSSRADSIDAVRLNFRVTNGLTGADLRVRDVTSVTRLPNNGLVQLRTCGSRPVLTGNLTATADPGVGGQVTIAWNPSVDETGGERDVLQYSIYRKLAVDPSFGPAILTQPPGLPSYSVQDRTGLVVGTNYIYAVGADDCTPQESTLLVSPTVAPVP